METSRVIFSWNEADPTGNDPTAVRNHGTINRGSVSINLLGAEQNPHPDPVDSESYTAIVNNVSLHVLGIEHALLES